MSGNNELSTFIKESLKQGQSQSQIEAVLLASGWKEKQIANAFAEYASVSSPVQVPRPFPARRDAFIYWLMFTALYVMVSSLISIIFSTIDQTYRPPLSSRSETLNIYQQESYKLTLVTFGVTFAIWLFLGHLCRFREARIPKQQLSRVRDWLVHATLLFAGWGMIGSIVSWITEQLKQVPSQATMWKSGTVFSIAALFFAFHLFLLLHEPRLKIRDQEAPISNQSPERQSQ